MDEPGEFVPSVRLELLRQGTVDAARFALLDRLLRACRADASETACASAAGAAAALARGEAALHAIDGVVWGFSPTIESVRVADKPADHPYEVVHAVRAVHAVLDEAAASIEELSVRLTPVVRDEPLAIALLVFLLVLGWASVIGAYVSYHGRCLQSTATSDGADPLAPTAAATGVQ